VHDRFLMHERLSASLSSDALEELAGEKLVRLRLEALLAIGEVYERLRLDPSARLTVRRFDAACKRYGLESSPMRVRHAWGSWQFAMDVFLGEKPTDRAGMLAINRLRRRVASTRRNAWESLREWLADDPRHWGREAYVRWYRARNTELDPEELPHMSAEGIEQALNKRFHVAVREARAGLDDGALAEQIATETICAGGHEFLPIGGIGMLLGHDKQTMTELARSDHQDPLPAHVARIGRVRLWLRDDVEAYACGELVQRVEGELAHAVLGTEALAVRLDITGELVRSRLKRLRTTPWLPRPTGRLHGFAWWDAEEVEAWLRANPERDPEARARLARIEIRANTIRAGGHVFYRRRAIAFVLGFSVAALDIKAAHARFPAPAARVGRVPLWLRADIEHFRNTRSVPDREPSFMQHVFYTTPQLADRLQLKRATFGWRLRTRSPTVLQPNGWMHNYPWWEARRVERWLAEHPEHDPESPRYEPLSAAVQRRPQEREHTQNTGDSGAARENAPVRRAF
jgi:hypothetical protein